MTTKTNNTKKLLLISLDGLSAEQFEYLSTTFDFLQHAPIKNLSNNTLNTAQGLWAEILSGQHWWETGCAGYAFPKNSINDLQIGGLSDYVFRSPIKADLTINVPLLAKAQDYHQPFSSPVYYLGNPTEGTKLCLEAETQRLIQAEKDFQRNSWQTGILRLTVFDHLSHLLGCNYLSDTDLAVHPAIRSFIKDAQKRLEHIIQASKANIAIISPYGHIACDRRVNINLLLSQLGFCKLKEKDEVEKSQILRHNSTIALATKKTASPLVSYTCEFVENATVAASPVYGAIYINRKDRFQNGIVDTQDVEHTAQEIALHLRTLTKEVGIDNLYLEINPDRGANSLAPDLMLYAESVDFHNVYDAPAVDTFSHPQTCHSKTGFVCFEDAPGNELNHASLNTILKERLK